MKFSIIIPVFNESSVIVDCLLSVQKLRRLGHEIIVVDGGSSDNTVELSKSLSDLTLVNGKGRARQMNAGAAIAKGEVLLFLHADTFVNFDLDKVFMNISNDTLFWGRFDVRLTGEQMIFRVIEYCMNIRSRLTGIATGDQAIFVSRYLFNKVGGFPDIELMEDVEISKRLIQHCLPLCFKHKVISSSRRWENKGIFKTILTMWSMRLRYRFGTSTSILAQGYDK